MNIKKPLLIAGAVTSVGLASVVGVATAATNSSTDPQAGIVDKLSTTFNLDKNEVQKVFDQEHAEREAEMQKRIEDRLSQAVTDGKITEEQKQKILAKHAELKAAMETEHETLKDKTPEERRTFMEQKHEELKKWAEDNDIPKEFMRFGFVKGGGPGMHKVMMHGDDGEVSIEHRTE